jgi:hypothetical protein
MACLPTIVNDEEDFKQLKPVLMTVLVAINGKVNPEPFFNLFPLDGLYDDAGENTNKEDEDEEDEDDEEEMELAEDVNVLMKDEEPKIFELIFFGFERRSNKATKPLTPLEQKKKNFPHSLSIKIRNVTNGKCVVKLYSESFHVTGCANRTDAVRACQIVLDEIRRLHEACVHFTTTGELTEPLVTRFSELSEADRNEYLEYVQSVNPPITSDSARLSLGEIMPVMVNYNYKIECLEMFSRRRFQRLMHEFARHSDVSFQLCNDPRVHAVANNKGNSLCIRIPFVKEKSLRPRRKATGHFTFQINFETGRVFQSGPKEDRNCEAFQHFFRLVKQIVAVTEDQMPAPLTSWTCQTKCGMMETLLKNLV